MCGFYSGLCTLHNCTMLQSLPSLVLHPSLPLQAMNLPVLRYSDQVLCRFCLAPRKFVLLGFVGTSDMGSHPRTNHFHRDSLKRKRYSTHRLDYSVSLTATTCKVSCARPRRVRKVLEDENIASRNEFQAGSHWFLFRFGQAVSHRRGLESREGM